MKRIIILSLFAFAFKNSFAQGCIAIKTNGNTCTMSHEGNKGWALNLNNRYFRSYKHFVGTVEQKQRVDSGTEVINKVYALDFTLTRVFDKHWSFALTMPISFNARSSKYEHYGNTNSSTNARRTTRATGLGDLRFSVYRWMFNPALSYKGNLQLGLGLKLPTGDYRYQDYFYKNDTTAVLGPVDQSIQLGDGGTGFSFEARGYYNINTAWGTYADFYYLMNPREQNGVSTARGGTPSANSIKYFSNYMSVADQFMVRAGANFKAKQFTFSGGIRVEALPSSDLIGGNKGFRRPGYILSAEPVISYMNKHMQFYISVPVALKRDRTQSYADKLQTAATGIKVQGDAAFADYSLNLGTTISF